MGTVYRARQTLGGRVQREVALKVIDARLMESPDLLTRFEREARTITALSHAHILKVFDYGQQDKTLYLVTELLGGASLAQMVQQGPLPIDTIVKVLDQIGPALDYAHSKGIVHRDLKPQNVLFDEAGNAFLTDFGIAKLLNNQASLTQSSTTVGTPAYM
jgi:serine/threonine-protein kinase